MSKGTARAVLRLALFAGLAWAASGLFGPACAQSFATYTVDRVKAAGILVVDLFRVQRDGTETTTTNDILVNATDTPERVASRIARVFGEFGVRVSATNPAKVEYNVTASGNRRAGFSGNANDVVGFSEDGERRVAFLPPPDTPVVDLGFLPNPSNGSDTLATPSMITAGFASGLAPVSFDASAGEDLDQLATMLDSALKKGGYLTSMPDPTDTRKGRACRSRSISASTR